MPFAEAIARIRRYDGRLHAFVRVFDRSDATGPTFAVKDLIDVAGVPTGGGGRNPLDPAPVRTAPTVQRLLDDDWAMVGKTHTVELAYGAWGTNRAVGAPWNPWDSAVHRCPGGSSSGSAVAVAAGLCDLALGTDTGGSVRIPASACGVVGLKPGMGLVPLAGVHPLAPSLDTVGTLAKSVAMAARGLGIIAGDGGRGFNAERALGAEARGRRVVALPLDQLGEIRSDVQKLYAEAQRRLREAGIEVIEARPPRNFERYFESNGVVMGGEGWRVRKAHIERHEADMDPAIVARFRAGVAITDEALARALETRSEFQAEFHGWLAQYDGMILPSAPITAPPLTEVDEAGYPLSRLTRGGNYLDLPAISIPCGRGQDGMPAGLQIMGRPRDEEGLVALAAAFERVSGWDGRTPDLSGFET